ncbi:unnamed protein product [Lymnaea stagnalis]|uniref:RHD domain-containing protein n=1 Tax=Lymnaea stagnalis TaxID=6523 RepID=A0AAV2HIL2_LYMST
MSSELKDAHSEFINTNASTIDKIMEGDNSGMSKDDHSIQDLVRYLADPTPPLSHKDSMMIDEKGNLQDPNFGSTQIHTTHQTLYNTIQVQGGAQDRSHIDLSDMCCSSTDSSYNSGSLQNSDAPNSHSNDQQHQQHQFLQHHNSFDLGVPMYPDSSGGASGVTDMIYTSTQSATQPVFEDSGSTNQGIGDQGHLQAMVNVGSETQFYHSEPNTQFRSSIPTDTNFHHTLQAQYSDNNVGQFQTQSQPDPGSFQNSTVLPSSYPSPSITQLHFSSTEENLGFSMMDVNHSLINNSRAEPTSQFKVPEKMHVDEPEGIYQAGHTSNTSQYHTGFQFKSDVVSRETDMQTSFNPEGCHQQTSQPNSFNISLDVFSQPLATSDEFSVSGASSSSGQSNMPFDTGNNIYTESTLPSTFDPSSFLNKNLLNSASLQASSTDFQMQQSLITTNSSVEMHYTPTQSSDVQSQSPEFSMQSSPNPSHHSYTPSQTSPSQGNQFQESTNPTVGNPSPSLQDTYQQAINSIQAQSTEFKIHADSNDEPVQFQQNVSSHQQPPGGQNTFQQSSGSDFVHAEIIGPALQSGGYQNSLTSPAPSSDQPLGTMGQQQNFTSPPNMQQIPTLEGPNGFMNFTGNNEVSLPQVQEPSDTNKSAGELSLDSFGTTCTATSELGSFPVGADAFPHLDLVSVVNGNFPVDQNLSSVQHRSLNIDGSTETCPFNPYQFEETNTSISFSSTPHTISNITSQAGLEFNQQAQTVQPVSSSVSTYLDTSSLTSSSDSQVDRYQLETPQFASSKGEQRFGFQTDHDHYPQPMQVQDSGFASKIPDAISSYPYQNHNQSRSPNNALETAMDISSSNQAERTISYEEIHRSIVKAGDQFAGSNSDNNSDYAITRSHLNNETSANLSDNSQPTYSTGSSGFYEDTKPMTSYSAMPESSTTCTTSSSSTTYSSDSSFIPVMGNSFENSLSALQQSTITDLLKSIQTSSAETPTHHPDVRNQISGSVPNFLDTPRASAASTDSMNYVSGGPVSQAQACFVVTMSAVSQKNTEPALTTSSLSQPSQPKLTIVTNPSISASQQGLNTSTITLGQNIFPNPILVSPFVNFSAASSSTTSSPIAQPQIITTNNIGRKPGINFSGPSSGSLPFLVQIPSHQLESKTSSHQNISTLAGKLNLNAVPVQKTNMATIVIPTTGTPVPKNNSQNNRQIFMSLEELQKLLSQEGLSQPSYQQTTSSPQTLVFQKPVSQTLRQNQPKLLIRGATFPSSSRLIQPQHQSLQTRDKLPLIIQQTSPSQAKAHEQTHSLAADSSKPFQLLVNQQPSTHKLQLFQQPQVSEQQPKISLHLKPMTMQQPLLIPSTEQIRLPFQLHGQRVTPMQTEPKASPESQVIYVTQIKQENHQGLQQEPDQEKEDKPPQFHQQGLDERSDRQCSDNLRKDYKHLHSLLTGDSSTNASTQVKSLPSVLNFPNNLQGNFQLSNGTTIGASSVSSNQARTGPHIPASTAPFSFLPLNSTPALSLGGSFLPFSSSGAVGTTNSFPTTTAAIGNSFSAPLTTLAFTNAFSSSFFSKPAESKDSKQEVAGNQLAFPQQSTQSSSHPGSTPSDGVTALDSSSRSLLAQILSDRKRSHTPLSVEINSPNSNSEAPSPLSSPVPFEDGSTQATLIERSADLHIKSDSMQGMNDDDDENASFFDLNAFHKRPSTEETLSPGDKNESVPMKILKGSLNADARSSVQPPLSPEPAFDIGSVVSTASSFSFAFGSKEDNSEVFTFGSGGTGTATTDALKCKDGSKHCRLSTPKPALKMPNGAARSNVPTQQVRPLSRKQKEYSLKAYYSSKFDGMELRILEQPEPHHRARYQTEGSRGAIKDASQQGFPIIKLMGYNKPTKLQVFIGDECGRVKPHGFYQACRVFGKNSTTCAEQEIEGTTVIEIDILPENDMTVKLDCIGILKLRNADVERRIGPKRARDKKKNNTRARLVLRAIVEKPDGVHHVLQVVSNPIVCTQPVGQPEISRMSLTECSIEGGQSLFIIGKNFKNKGTSVLFQKLDVNDDTVSWQAEAEIEQEFFQPTHLICKVPPFKDHLISKPEQVQIVVSCAGKKSDSHLFTYKPVYQVASMVKLEVPMETDTATSSTSMSFVSPEALHLNRMVHQTHAQSSTSSAMFQLPPGTIPTLQNSSPGSTSCTVNPLSHQVPLSHSVPVVSSSAPAVSPMTNPSLSETMSERTLQTFLLDEKPDGLVSKSQAETMTSLAPADNLQSDKAQVNCTAQRSAETSELESTSNSVCGDSPAPTNANGTGVSHHAVSSPSLASALSSKPFVVVLDPGSFQSDSGDKIQQLLQQILEAQSKQAF